MITRYGEYILCEVIGMLECWKKYKVYRDMLHTLCCIEQGGKPIGLRLLEKNLLLRLSKETLAQWMRMLGQV